MVHSTKQTANDRRMHDYSQADFAAAREIRDNLEPVREAIRSMKPAGKPTAHGKYWQELLGQGGGHVRHQMRELTQSEKDATRAAF